MNASTTPQRIILIGASAGGFEAIKEIINSLPATFEIPIFIVWHMSAGVQGILPSVINKLNKIPAGHAIDNEEIKPNRIYIAPPDFHMLIDKGRVRVTHGPKENRFRPAVDPLFRSGAYNYGNHVIGVVLSGGLDDGTAGLWRIKQNGGITIVQDPADAEVPSMPQSALNKVEIDYCVPVKEMAGLFVKLSTEKIPEVMNTIHDEKTKIEIDIATKDNAFTRGSMNIGEMSMFTCPECHGVLLKINEGKLIRFRCHTGHAYSADALLEIIIERSEENLYNALRGIEENIMLLNHIGDHFAEDNNSKVAATYFQKARELQGYHQMLHNLILQHEEFSIENFQANNMKGELKL